MAQDVLSGGRTGCHAWKRNEMRSLTAVFSIVVVALFATTKGHAHEARLRIDVSPRISTAPATIRVRSIVEPNAMNRALEVAADSGDFYTRSLVPIAGLDAAEVTETMLKNLPGGDYDISVALVDAQGKLIVEHTQIKVTAIGR